MGRSTPALSTLPRMGVALLVAATALSCQGAPDAGSDGQPTSTRRMVAHLDSINDADDPEQNVYLNRGRVRLLRERQLPDNLRVRTINRSMIAQELLNAGAVEEALAVLDSVRASIPEIGVEVPEEFRLNVHDLVAITHLHAWHRANCIERSDTGACLVPPDPASEPTAGEHARTAVEAYRTILEATPEDRDIAWLFNLAHMAAGDHPEGVPERWRIPESALRGDGEMDRFSDAAPGLGLDVLGHAGGGIVDDLDGDGDLDMMVSGRGADDQLRYFRNEGDGRFTEATVEAGLEGLTQGLHMIHADYDNDGDLDVLVLRGAWGRGRPGSLLRNDGDGTFTDVTEEAGLLADLPTQTAAWADYDGDGLLDLFVGYETQPERPTYPARLYRNEGDGTFTDVAPELGVDVVGFTKGVTWGDVDNDGRPDLYVSRLDQENRLFVNEGPDGDGGWSFRDATAEAGVAGPVESFPTWFFDYDNDGWLDLFVSGYSLQLRDLMKEYLGTSHEAVAPRLYRNRGDGTFEDVTDEVGLDRTGLYTMGSNFGDLDNDGWQDFYAGTGDPDMRALMPNRMFRNVEGEDGTGRRFREVTVPGGFGHLAKGHAVSFADIDNDGDQDVHTVLGGAYEGDVARNALFENPGHGHRWITLRLEGRESNRSAMGARVRVTVEEDGETREIHRRVTAGGSFGGNSLQLEIGLGDADGVTEVEIHWPVTERRDVYTDVEMDRIYRVAEGDEGLEPVQAPAFELSG